MKVRDNRTGRSSFRLDPFSFGSFFEYRTPRKITIASNPVAIAVSPLPTPPTSASFWNAAPLVGRTSLSVQYEKSPIDVSGSKSIHVVIETLGNANPLKALPLQATDAFRVYQETPQLSYSMEGDLLKMRVIFSASIVPTRPGTISLPPIQLTYFDPTSTQFETLRSEPIEFAATGTLPLVEQEPAADTLVSDSIPQPGESLIYRPRSAFDSLAERISGGLLIFISLVLVAMTAIGWLAVPLVRHRQYYRRTRSRLSDATTTDAIWQTFDKHVQRMTGLKTSRFQHAELAQELSHYISNKDLLFSVQHFLDTMDSARFQKHDSSIPFEELREQAVRIVTAWH